MIRLHRGAPAPRQRARPLTRCARRPGWMLRAARRGGWAAGGRRRRRQSGRRPWRSAGGVEREESSVLGSVDARGRPDEKRRGLGEGGSLAGSGALAKAATSPLRFLRCDRVTGPPFYAPHCGRNRSCALTRALSAGGSGRPATNRHAGRGVQFRSRAHTFGAPLPSPLTSASSPIALDLLALQCACVVAGGTGAARSRGSEKEGGEWISAILAEIFFLNLERQPRLRARA